MIFIKKFKIFLLALTILGQNYCYSASQSTMLFESKMTEITAPANLQELKFWVDQARAQHKKISIVGAGKSQGGQTVCPPCEGYRLSLHKLNRLISLKPQRKLVTVQAGMTWRQLQEHLAPHGLAVKAMQSYNDFSVGGSLSVNVHGQDLESTPLSKTVKSFKLMQDNGHIVPVSRIQNPELFSLVLGGYGLFGIITEVTLEVTEDVILEKKVTQLPTKQLPEYFERHVKTNPAIQFYSARFSVGASDLLEKVLVLTYEKTNKSDPKLFEFTSAHASLMQKIGLLGMAKLEFLKNWRYDLEKNLFELPGYISRNNFMNDSLAGLPYSTKNSLYILQEYFIPYESLNEFIDYLRYTIKCYSINLLNLTARHVHQNSDTALSYAPHTDVCALVLYVQLEAQEKFYDTTIAWTRKVIEQALSLKGTFYLPYHLIATRDQLNRAYPAFKHFLLRKKFYDPRETFTNMFYQSYAH